MLSSNDRTGFSTNLAAKTLTSTLVLWNRLLLEFYWSWIHAVSGGWEGSAAMSPTFLTSEPHYLQADLQTPHQRLRTPHSGSGTHTTGSEPQQNGSIEIFNTKQRFFCQNSFVMFKKYINTSTKYVTTHGCLTSVRATTSAI